MHIPERTCIGCYKKFPQQKLLAIRKLKDETILLDQLQEKKGRSVYLCKNQLCLQKFMNKKGKGRISHGLKGNIPEELWKELVEGLQKLTF